MRYTWPFIAGMIVAGLVTLFTLPIMIATGLAMMFAGTMGHTETVLGGGSTFTIRDDHGRYATRLLNTTYNLLSIPMVGEPRPHRMLVRLRTILGEDGDGRVRVDTWRMGSPTDLRQAPQYTIRAKANSAILGDDYMLWTEHSGRRSAYSLATGLWLFDADLPVINFNIEAETRRMAALSLADDEFSSRGGVVVISYAAPGRVLKRVILTASDPMRVNTLRASISVTRLVVYSDEATGGRVIELPLAAGPLRIPVRADDLDLSRAVVPAGLKLVPIQPWN
ncbi:conserved hypothetical protein [Candidatus Terasakiella magnetica]|nr:conserved hypothetical protein [Candidatus Terasakiella magnetica]